MCCGISEQFVLKVTFLLDLQTIIVFSDRILKLNELKDAKSLRFQLPHISNTHLSLRATYNTILGIRRRGFIASYYSLSAIWPTWILGEFLGFLLNFHLYEDSIVVVIIAPVLECSVVQRALCLLVMLEIIQNLTKNYLIRPCQFFTLIKIFQLVVKLFWK